MLFHADNGMNKYALTLYIWGHEALTLVLWRRIDNEQAVPELHAASTDTVRRPIGFRGKVVS